MSNRSVTAACMAASMVLGSIHAFSVLIPGWEAQFQASRSSVSFIYSLSLCSLTIAVLFGHHLYQLLSVSQIFSLAAVASAIGLLLSSTSESLVSVYLYYGCLFGAANGLGYGFALQLAGQASGRHHALSMSLVTAFYAVGAVLAAPLFQVLVNEGGNRFTLKVVASIVFIVCIAAALLLAKSETRFVAESSHSKRTVGSRESGLRLRLWLAYGSAVAAGLMVIGHAFTLVLSKHPSTTQAALAPLLIALGNVFGGLSMGFFANRVQHRHLLLLLPALSLAGLLLLLQTLLHQLPVTLLALAVMGFSYGAIIALYPVVVSDCFGKLASSRIYGQVFTAWGLAGLLAPWASGMLFDHFGGYQIALAVAALLSLISIFVIHTTDTSIRPA